MSHPGTGAFSSGSSVNNRQYFYRLARRYKAERANIQGLIEDLSRSPFELPRHTNSGWERDLKSQWSHKLAQKYVIKG